RPDTRAREEELLADPALAGQLFKGFRVEWSRGFVRTLRNFEHVRGPRFGEIIRHPSCRFLEDLTLFSHDSARCLAALRDAQPLLLRRLHLTTHEVVLADLPALSVLEVHANRVELGALGADTLEKLELNVDRRGTCLA